MNTKEATERIKSRYDKWALDDKDLEAIRCTFPELRESEDERIRKGLISYLKSDMEYKPSQCSQFYNEAITYLEKQKEQKPLSTEEAELNSIAFLEQMGYTCIPPKKEHQNNSGTPNESSWRGINSPSGKDKNLDDIAQDYVEAVKEYNPDLTWDLMQTAVCYGYNCCKQEEQKPVDKVSVNDELYEHIRKVCACIEDAMSSDTMCDMTDYLEMANSSAQKAFDMVDRSVVKQPAEWSEEDEKILDELLDHCNTENATWYNWLKSLPERFNLQPKNEWSEDDIDKMVNARARKSGTTKSEMEFYRYGIKDTLKSLRPQLHWKPSEQQMGALRMVVQEAKEKNNTSVSGYGRYLILESLHKQLEKLMNP